MNKHEEDTHLPNTYSSFNYHRPTWPVVMNIDDSDDTAEILKNVTKDTPSNMADFDDKRFTNLFGPYLEAWREKSTSYIIQTYLHFQEDPTAIYKYLYSNTLRSANYLVHLMMEPPELSEDVKNKVPEFLQRMLVDARAAAEKEGIDELARSIAYTPPVVFRVLDTVLIERDIVPPSIDLKG